MQRVIPDPVPGLQRQARDLGIETELQEAFRHPRTSRMEFARASNRRDHTARTRRHRRATRHPVSPSTSRSAATRIHHRGAPSRTVRRPARVQKQLLGATGPVKRRHGIPHNKNEGCKLLIMKRFWSGRPGSNRRRSAWEADILPLNYSRPGVDNFKVTTTLSPHKRGIFHRGQSGLSSFSSKTLRPPAD